VNFSKRIFSITLALVALATGASAQVPLVGFPDATPDGTLGIPNSGKFINTSRGLSTLGDVAPKESVFNVELIVPASLSTWKLSIFDAEISAQWDRLPVDGTPDQIQFELYKDPNLEGSTEPEDLLGIWDAEPIALDANNQWCDIGRDQNDETVTDCTDTPGGGTPMLPRVDEACPDAPPNGNCYYHLVARWKTEDNTNESNLFKVAVEGTPFILAGSSVGFQAFDRDYADAASGFPPTAYDGTFEFQFFVPEEELVLDFFDGDFDRGDDGDDLNTPSEACRDLNSPADYVSSRFSDSSPPTIESSNVTAWLNNQDLDQGCSIQEYDSQLQNFVEVPFPPFQTSPATLAEGANPGAPRDDVGPDDFPLFVFPPEVFWSLSAPPSNPDPQSPPLWTEVNENPSGNNEWELYRIGKSGEGVQNTDSVKDSIPAGLYTWKVEGADALNNLFVFTRYDLFPSTNGTCDLAVTKTCKVTPPANGSLKCESAIAATTLRYIGPGIENATVRFVGKNAGDETYTGVDLTPGTVLENADGWTVDGRFGKSRGLGAKTSIFINGVLQEVIHTSCSQPYIAGQPAPLDGSSPNKPKDGAASSNWSVERFVDKAGNNVAIPSSTGSPSNQCEVLLTKEGESAEVMYEYEVTGGSTADTTDVVLYDSVLGQIAGPFDLPANTSEVFQRTAKIAETTENVATVVGLQGINQCVANASAIVTVNKLPPPLDGEGCTPGYWKQKHHFGSWTGYKRSDRFQAVFGVTGYDVSLLEAVKAGGGGLKALGRHAVAALLNSVNPDVNYAYTEDEVIAAVRAVFNGQADVELIKDLLASANESFCPLGRNP
jgi:hypothetical protein